MWGLHSLQFRGMTLLWQTVESYGPLDRSCNQYTPQTPSLTEALDSSLSVCQPKPEVLLSPLQLVRQFVGCNWVLFRPPAPHVFLIATIEESVVKMRYCCASGLRHHPVAFIICVKGKVEHMKTCDVFSINSPLFIMKKKHP